MKHPLDTIVDAVAWYHTKNDREPGVYTGHRCAVVHNKCHERNDEPPIGSNGENGPTPIGRDELKINSPIAGVESVKITETACSNMKSDTYPPNLNPHHNV